MRGRAVAEDDEGITALAAPTQANLHSRKLTYFLPLAI